MIYSFAALHSPTPLYNGSLNSHNEGELPGADTIHFPPATATLVNTHTEKLDLAGHSTLPLGIWDSISFSFFFYLAPNKQLNTKADAKYFMDLIMFVLFFKYDGRWKRKCRLPERIAIVTYLQFDRHWIGKNFFYIWDVFLWKVLFFSLSWTSCAERQKRKVMKRASEGVEVHIGFLCLNDEEAAAFFSPSSFREYVF